MLNRSDSLKSIQFSNCIIQYNGCGAGAPYSELTFTNNICNRNKAHNLYLDYISHVVNHCVFYSGEYGIYTDSNAGTLTIKNSICDANSLYGIYAEIALTVTYMCITSGVNTNVDNSDTTNIVDSPQFVNIVEGSEDFHIKTFRIR